MGGEWTITSCWTKNDVAESAAITALAPPNMPEGQTKVPIVIGPQGNAICDPSSRRHRLVGFHGSFFA
jgi:hypothetical protein